MKPTVGSLFAGIGGFDLGFERAGFRVVWQVENEPYCQRVLAKHWPDVPRWGDVRTFTGEGYERPEVIIGGFPCQDISLAGGRAGLAGERSGLWWEFARVVRVFRPRVVVVENTPGLLVPVRPGEQSPIGCVLGELAILGYDAEWQTIPASAFGSTQQRRRVFIVAYSAGTGDGRRVFDANHVRAGHEELHVPAVATGEGFHRRLSDAIDTNTAGDGSGSRGISIVGRSRLADAKRHGQSDGGVAGQRSHHQSSEADTNTEWNIRRSRPAKARHESGERRSSSESRRRDSPFIGAGWWSAEPTLVRMVYGIPRRLVRPAIQGLGNCVIPQVAEYVGQCVMQAFFQGGQP